MEKLRDVRHEDIPEINNPKIRFPVLEGEQIVDRHMIVMQEIPRVEKEKDIRFIAANK